MNLPQSYSILALSLGGIFIAGGIVGFWLGKGQGSLALPGMTESIGTVAGASPQDWADQAMTRLVADLELTSEQQGRVRSFLTTAADRVFVERDRALLQMHLRLLEVHDTLSRDANLNEAQKKRLASSRTKLKDSILARFASLLKTESGTLPDL